MRCSSRPGPVPASDSPTRTTRAPARGSPGARPRSSTAADLLVKVKEPQLHECAMLRRGQVLFTYLHLAADPDQARALCDSGATAIAYETVTAPDGSLPLLTPMSEVAGRMSVQVGAHCLQKANGGTRAAARRGAGREAREGGDPGRRRRRHPRSGDGRRPAAPMSPSWTGPCRGCGSSRRSSAPP